MNKYVITNCGLTVDANTEYQAFATGLDMDHIYFAKQVDGGEGTENCWLVYSRSNADPVFLGWFLSDEKSFETDLYADIEEWYGEEMIEKIEESVKNFDTRE